MSLTLSLACSSREIDLGGGRITSDLRSSSRCAESATLDGDIRVTNQNELAELAGCEEITGELRIETFEGADLAPLASLRRVGVALELGADPQIYPEDPDEQVAFWEGIAALQAAGYLPSLADLASLESVPTLYLTGSSVRDLTELSSLVDVDAVIVRNTPSLENLAGLEAVTLSDVWITNAPALVTLDGLTLGLTPATVIFETVPALKNADALAGVFSADSLYFYGTGLAALPVFRNLQFVNDLRIEQNPELVDISSIYALGGADSLVIAGNASLRAIPSFPSLSTLDVLRVVSNDALEELTLDFPALTPPQNSLTDRNIELSATLIEISLNDALRRIAPPQSFTAVQFFSIFQNPSLTEVNLDQLRRADLLIVDQNTSLTSFTAPSLATVDSLEVLDNPALSPAVFDSIQTFDRQISGNAEPAAL
jgi:hypothetical protein